MSRRKGELSQAAINRGWPHQIALSELEAREQYERHDQIALLLRRLPAAPRGHTVFHGGAVYNVYCFATAEAAQTFQSFFGGEPFDPRDKGSGVNWGRWHKGRGAELDARRRR